MNETEPTYIEPLEDDDDEDYQEDERIPREDEE